ncbi:MAG TPA: hypothetical protein VGG60_11665 [Candidatus Binataceae bacterium]
MVNADGERNARAIDDAREDVAAELVGAEREHTGGRRRVAEGVGDRASGIVGGEPRREDGDDDEAENHQGTGGFHRIEAGLHRGRGLMRTVSSIGCGVRRKAEFEDRDSSLCSE